MNRQEAKRIIDILATPLSEGEYLEERLKYTKYVRAITQLIASTHYVEWAAAVFAMVITQGEELDKSYEWVISELEFEKRASATGNRDLMLSCALSQTTGDDQALDLYNLRRSRPFGHTSSTWTGKK